MGGSSKKAESFAPEMTEEEIAEAMEKLFGKGTKKSRAEDALPLILEEIGKQRAATLDTNIVPSVLGQLIMENPTMADSVVPQKGILNLLAQAGESQITPQGVV
jgi:hypothetical protein